MRGAPDGPKGQNWVGTCGVGGVSGHSGDGGLERDDFLDTSLNRLFFFFSVFPSGNPLSNAAAEGSPNSPTADVMV